jgi:hypothetical protein
MFNFSTVITCPWHRLLNFDMARAGQKRFYSSVTVRILLRLLGGRAWQRWLQRLQDACSMQLRSAATLLALLMSLKFFTFA